MESKTTVTPATDPSRDNPRDNAVEHLLFDNPMVRAGAVVASIGSSLVAAVRTINKEFYNENKMKAPLTEAYNERQTAINANNLARDLGHKTLDAYRKKSKQIETDWRNLLAETWEKRGIPSKGWQKYVIAPFKKAATLNPGDAAKIGFTTLGTFGVTMGAYFLVRKMSRYSHQLNQIDDKLDDLKTQLDAKHAQDGASADHADASAPSHGR